MEDVHKKIRKSYVEFLLEKNERMDGRDFFEFREISLEYGMIGTAEGSAIAKIGKTTVIAGVKFEISEPFPSDPEKGILITNAEFLPLASESFDLGPPTEKSIEFSRVIDRGIRHGEIIPLEKFLLDDGKALALFLDLYVLDYGGNLIDTGSLAAMAALLNTKLPKVEDSVILRDEYQGPLELRDIVVTTTFAKIKDRLILDPSLEEEDAADCFLTIGTSSNYMVSAQKTGSGTFKKEEVLELVDKAFEKRKDLLKYLNNIRD